MSHLSVNNVLWYASNKIANYVKRAMTCANIIEYTHLSNKLELKDKKLHLKFKMLLRWWKRFMTKQLKGYQMTSNQLEIKWNYSDITNIKLNSWEC